MGIKDIKVILKKYAKDGMRSKKLSEYSRKIITVDTSIYLYKYKYKYQNDFIYGFVLFNNKIIKK